MDNDMRHIFRDFLGRPIEYVVWLEIIHLTMTRRNILHASVAIAANLSDMFPSGPLLSLTLVVLDGKNERVFAGPFEDVVKSLQSCGLNPEYYLGVRDEYEYSKFLFRFYNYSIPLLEDAKILSECMRTKTKINQVYWLNLLSHENEDDIIHLQRPASPPPSMSLSSPMPKPKRLSSIPLTINPQKKRCIAPPSPPPPPALPSLPPPLVILSEDEDSDNDMPVGFAGRDDDPLYHLYLGLSTSQSLQGETTCEHANDFVMSPIVDLDAFCDCLEPAF